MAEPTTPPNAKRQKVQVPDDTTPVASSSAPSTPIISKTGTNRRVIPDTPGTPAIQVLASSPVPVNGHSQRSNFHPSAAQAPIQAPSNNAVNAVAEAMKLANPAYAPRFSYLHPGFPSQMSRHSAPPIQYPGQQNMHPGQTVIPQSPPNAQPHFNNFVSQFSYNPQMAPIQQMTPMQQMQQSPYVQSAPQPTMYQPRATSMAGAYGMPNRARPIASKQTQPVQASPIQMFIAPRPVGTLPTQGTPLRALMDMFPMITEEQAVNALTACKGSLTDASARITEDPLFGNPNRPISGFGVTGVPKFAQKTYANSQRAATLIQPTTKRTLKAPIQSIQQKYTHLAPTQNFVPNTYPYNVAPRPITPSDSFTPFTGPPSSLSNITVSPKKQPTKKRKLVRGKSKHLDSDGDSILSDEDESEVEIYRDEEFEEKLLDFLNTASKEEISDISLTPIEHVEVFVSNRPFGSLEECKGIELPPSAEDGDDSPKKGRGRRRTANRGKNIGNRIVDGVEGVLSGYNGVDDLISECEAIGKRVREKLAKWTASSSSVDEGALTLTSLSPSTPSTATTNPSPAPSDTKETEFLVSQPASLAADVALKDYQLIGVSWLHLLYKEGLSCILADEMGLGKTCQVIAFLGGLLEKTGGRRGKHLVVVPSSTIENWLREFKRFCPSLVVEPYYGDQKTRAELRYSLEARIDEYHVIVTTYKLATGAKEDRLFLKKMKFDVCIFDEGHMLKNSMSKQYTELMKLTANFRVLLTGTPLQNNLIELISLLSFMLPSVFAKNSDALQSIFKLKPSSSSVDASAALLSQQRIARAKAMMTPFVLRRRKIHVLKDLPKKVHQVEYCEMGPEQKTIYHEILQKQKDQIAARAKGELPANEGSNVLMQLRKAASHPLLFRRIYNDAKIKVMAKEIMKEEKYSTPEHTKEAILEDMEWMWDFTLHKLCLENPSISRFSLRNDEWMHAAKIEKLKGLLPEMKARGDRILLFSFFTMVLDILEVVLDTLGIQYMRLDGQTKVDERQDMIDQFHEEEDVTVFLLSTKAGGFGINLACANVVIIFDGSFNPHDDKQAEDRAHRVGQTRDVTVIRLVVKDTIEEQILHLADTKLALDQEMSETKVEDDEKAELAGEKFVARMLMGKNGEDTPATGSAVPSRVVTPAPP